MFTATVSRRHFHPIGNLLYDVEYASEQTPTKIVTMVLTFFKKFNVI